MLERGEEVAIGSLFDRVSDGVGQAYLHSDGFRRDFNLDQHIEQAFIRVDPSEFLSVRRRRAELNTHEGNRNLSLDPAEVALADPTQHSDLGLSVYRVGARLDYSDAGDLLGLGDPVRWRLQPR